MKLSYTDRANKDIEVAILLYERQRKGLGLEFLECISKGEKLIKSDPKIYPKVYSIFRRCVIHRFPFAIYFTIENSNEIVVHSVFDNRQNPNKKP